MAKKAYADLYQAQQSGNMYKLKRLFYALRAVCGWVLHYEQMSHIEFAPAYQQTDISSSIVTRIDELIDFKSMVDESYQYSGDEELLNFIGDTLVEVDNQPLALPDM